MAKLMLIGDVAQVEILPDPEDEELVLARCTGHNDGMTCLAGGGLMGVYWQERYDTIDDAVEYAAGHADCGRK